MLKVEVFCAMVLASWCAVADAQRGPPAQSGQLLGALRRDGDGKIVVWGPLRPMPGAVRQGQDVRSNGQGARRHGGRVLPAIAARGFIHQAEAARYRRRILDAIGRAQRGRRAGAPTNAAGLTLPQARLVDWLKSRDGEVRRHEAAHYRTGQPYTKWPVFEFITGPDGRRYAISGQVSFNFKNGGGGDGSRILRRLRAAALAPRKPSARDREIANALAVAMRRLQ